MCLKIKCVELNNLNMCSVTVSDVAPVSELRNQIQSVIGVKPQNQRLFYKGKQLEDFHTIIDYDLKENDVVQLMIKHEADAVQTEQPCSSSSSDISGDMPRDVFIPAASKYFRIGDYVDVRYGNLGWYEARIVEIFVKYPAILYNPEKAQELAEASNELFYKTVVEYNGNQTHVEAELGDIRPVARNKIKLSELKKNDIVLVNYNFEEPEKIGNWYEFCVSEVKTKRGRALLGTLLVGRQKVPYFNTKINYLHEIFHIEEPCLLENRSSYEEIIFKTPIYRKGRRIDYCQFCNNHPRKNCRQCACCVCGIKKVEEETVLCDDCDKIYHFTCLNPPLDALPDAEWYCPECKTDMNEIVKAGERLKESKNKAKMVSKQTKRSWDFGMANADPSKECTLVSAYHYGPIPGVEVGQAWRFRIQVSKAGVHRTPVAGIHGRSNDGAYSLCLSGGYEDDIDNGNDIFYSGSGGQDFGKQSRDQKLTNCNKALAMNCAAKFNEKGATAENWKEGKPVRVIRNYKLAKRSKYAPEIGNRYDGIYKVVKYFPEKGKSGFIIWRFLLQRDDPDPAPWTAEGKKRIEDLGLEISEASEDCNMKGNSCYKSKKQKCSTQDASTSSQNIEAHTLSSFEVELMKMDKLNKRRWDECCQKLKDGKEEFFSMVQQAFKCVICLNLVRKPVTLSCAHNICKNCLKDLSSANLMTCPVCRAKIDDASVADINQCLEDLLNQMFPGINTN